MLADFSSTRVVTIMTILALTYSLTSIAYGLLAIGLIGLRRTPAIALAGFLTAVWALSFLIYPALQDAAWFLQTAGWLGVIGALSRRFTPESNVRLRRATTVAIVCCLAVAMIAALVALVAAASEEGIVVEARLFFALIILILIENVYRNADDDIRWHLNLPLIAIAVMAVFTFVLYGEAIVHHRLSISLLQAQAVVYILVMPLFIGSESRMRRWRNRVSMSHGAAFYTSSLILGGSFLVGLGLAGSVLGRYSTYRYGRDWGTVIEITMVFIGLIVVAILASSGSARSRLRRLVTDNFFAQRYDYRQEWLRCIETLAAIEQGGLPQRVIRVLADTVDSPAGALLLRNDMSNLPAFEVAGEWNMRAPVGSLDESHPLIVRLSESFHHRLGSGPPIIVTSPDTWLAIALPDPRSAQPIGVVLLAKPRAGDGLGDESIALLRVVAREISLMLAERRAAEALAEARRFAAAGQRFAFVAHDIKNVANQLALLVSNADHHMDDPAFRDDMMATLRGSVGKIQSMLTRLKSPEVLPAIRLDVGERLRLLNESAWAKSAIGVLLTLDDRATEVAIEPSAFDAVMNHLIENAIEASKPGQTVAVQTRVNDGMLCITITDRGAGMSETFIRDQLFRPFSSSKPSGFGLGAFQARELVHAAGGTVSIASTIDLGTEVTLRFPALDPLAAHANLLVA
ncbi:XrtA/PEP-CTERM system histidine kinase PrsK [Acidiphilium acidophilum]|uniref:XrtA/PEP-CTERM system histidine kinase PrsK n=1 Tax=Acidiphilium acidophilum TaxID=76588 RepID=UPI002E8E7660|nr:XrtA/PEP-CTERM system histidine kinase PrsK [Acidiphilium acidophilum]